MRNRIVHQPTPFARRRRRGSARLFVLGAAFAAGHFATASVVSATPPQAVTEQPNRPSLNAMSFAIAPGPLDTVVAEFERVTGLHLRFADARLGAIQSMGVSGTLTPAAALDALLAGTALRA